MPAKSAPKKNTSALKRARQDKKRRLRNQSIKTALKTFSKKVESEVAGKNIEGAKSALQKAISATDKAVSKGIIHRNTASRKVSQLTRRVNSQLQTGTA